MTTEVPPPQPQPQRSFSVAGLLGGLLVAIIFGAIAAFFAGMVGMSTNSHPLAFLIGLLPGAIFVIIGALLRKKDGFAQGLIIGGCIIGLIGGICGQAMVGMSFR